MREKKRVIFIKSADSDIFDEAYFVLKSDKSTKKRKENFTRDMVCEANRVIDEKIGSDKRRRKALILASVISFLFGALISCAAAMILVLCLS